MQFWSAAAAFQRMGAWAANQCPLWVKSGHWATRADGG